LLLRRCRPAAALCAIAVAAGPCAGGAAPPPPIRHVFVVMLENQPFEHTYGAGSPAHYLKSLRHKGALAVNYFGTSHASLGNYLALISGQASNEIVNLDCEVYAEFVGTGTGLSPEGQAVGKGCVYPAYVTTLANQLEAANLRWKGYMEDMGNHPRRESATCGHPPIGAPDNTQMAEVGDQYAARHNPFVYFHAIIDTPSCARNVVNLSALAPDLSSVDTTPNYLFIVPNLCHDAHDGAGGGRCVDGAPGGLVAADRFLGELVPKILASPAYRRDGLLIITYDESELDESVDSGGRSVLSGDAAACCNEPPGPNLPPYQPGAAGSWEHMNGPGIIGPGGGRVGALLLSPYIRPGTISMAPYNHYALLKSVEDIFNLPHLGYAALPGLQGFGADLYTQPPAVAN
jgi:hypothetical protein